MKVVVGSNMRALATSWPGQAKSTMRSLCSSLIRPSRSDRGVVPVARPRQPGLLQTAARNRFARHWRFDAVASRLTRPVVSFTFDDFPRSAATAGARVLEAQGYRGTFYASGILAECTMDGIEYYRVEDLRRLLAAGHEIGCHTFDHLRLPEAPRGLIERSVLRNREFMRAAVADDVPMSSFAYPYGAASLTRKWQMQGLYPVCRSIVPQVNHGRIDFGYLGAFSLESRDLDVGRIGSALDEAVRCNGWVILFTHDVSDTPSHYGCPTRAFETVVRMVKERGIDVMPVKNAAARVRFS